MAPFLFRTVAISSEARTTQFQLWIDRLRAGDAAAREQLLATTRERLRRLARKMLRDYPGVRALEETDDVFQDGMVRLWRALQAVTPPTVRDYFRLAAWHLRAALIDLARHHYGPQGAAARQGRRFEAGNPDDMPPAVEPADSSLEPSRLLFWTEFHRQVEALPKEEREVFDLLWYHELSQTEAAALLGVSDKTVRKLWRAARRRLQKALPGDFPEE